MAELKSELSRGRLFVHCGASSELLERLAKCKLSRRTSAAACRSHRVRLESGLDCVTNATLHRDCATVTTETPATTTVDPCAHRLRAILPPYAAARPALTQSVAMPVAAVAHSLAQQAHAGPLTAAAAATSCVGNQRHRAAAVPVHGADRTDRWQARVALTMLASLLLSTLALHTACAVTVPLARTSVSGVSSRVSPALAPGHLQGSHGVIDGDPQPQTAAPWCPDDPPSGFVFPCDIKPDCTKPPSQRVCRVTNDHELPIGAATATCSFQILGTVVLDGGALWKQPCGGGKGAVIVCECDVVFSISEALHLSGPASIRVPSLQVIASRIVVGEASVISAVAMGPEFHGAAVAENIDGTYGGGGGHAGMGGVAGQAEEQCQSPYSQLTRAGSQYGSVARPYEFGGAGGGRAEDSFHNIFSARGGGRIALNASDSVVLEGMISADGGSVSTHTTLAQGGGGAGGSIQVASPMFRMGATAMLGARGGDSSIGGGGSGGRIALACDSTEGVRADVYGGRHGRNLNCGTGATGTIFHHSAGILECGGGGMFHHDGLPGDLLPSTYLVDSGPMPPLTEIWASGCSLDVSSWDSARNNGTLSLVLMVASVMRVASVVVDGPIVLTRSSRLLTSDGQGNMELFATQVDLQDSLISTSGIGAGSDLIIAVSGALSVDKGSFLHFASSANISATTIVVENDITDVDLADETRLLLQARGSISLSRTSNIAADYVVVSAPQVSALGTVTANHPALQRCTAPVLEPRCAEDAATAVYSAATPLYSAWISAQELTIESSGIVQGAAISVCATNATITGRVDASAFGCDAGSGPGAGVGGDVNTAPCGGGAHGGDGGASQSNAAGVRAAGGLHYDNFTLPFSGPSMLGSGGGGSTLGGRGGGLIRILATNELQLGGIIAADGGNGLSTLLVGPSTAVGDTSGGGGAGGTLLLHLGRLTFVGSGAQLSAAGGAGGVASGGGGGGVILLTWLRGGANVQGGGATGRVVRINGGAADHNLGGAGSAGVAVTSPGCAPGSHGLFCSVVSCDCEL